MLQGLGNFQEPKNLHSNVKACFPESVWLQLLLLKVVAPVKLKGTLLFHMGDINVKEGDLFPSKHEMWI